jgi:hypothetical protein
MASNRVKTASGPTKGAGVFVPIAISDGTDPILAVEQGIASWSKPMQERIHGSAKSGSETTESESPSTSPTSKPLVGRSKTSKERWQPPKDVKELAQMVTVLATAVLNGDIVGEDLESVRIVAGLVRTAAQLKTAEVGRARLMREAPDLSFEDDSH